MEEQQLWVDTPALSKTLDVAHVTVDIGRETF
jgi:hypothetical protein